MSWTSQKSGFKTFPLLQTVTSKDEVNKNQIVIGLIIKLSKVNKAFKIKTRSTSRVTRTPWIRDYLKSQLQIAVNLIHMIFYRRPLKANRRYSSQHNHLHAFNSTQKWTTVKALNFPPRGNFSPFFQTSLVTSERVLQKIAASQSLRNRLEPQIWSQSFIWRNSPEGATGLPRKYGKFPWGGKLGIFTATPQIQEETTLKTVIITFKTVTKLAHNEGPPRPELLYPEFGEFCDLELILPTGGGRTPSFAPAWGALACPLAAGACRAWAAAAAAPAFWGCAVCNTSSRHVGHVCCRWNHDRRHNVWNMWLHGSRFAPEVISSRQMMQVLSELASSSGVTSG
jgi:hypothetical protein